MSEPKTRHRALQLALVLCLATHALAASEPRLPLEKAAHTGDILRTRQLLAEGQSQYARDSALEHAINAGHRDVMELLITHGAKGALYKAAAKGDIGLVKHFLAREEDPAARDSAFHAAVRMQHTELAKLLLDRGADVDTRRWNKLTPLFFAVTGNRDGSDITRWLTQIRYERSKNRGRPPATLDIVEFLISRGADVNAKGGSPTLTPLYYAIHAGSTEIVAALIAHGADVNTKVHMSYVDSRFTTPLHLAADYGDLPMCRLLIEHGADVNAQMPAATSGSSRNARRTPLHHATSSSNAQLVTFLLDQGAEINAVSGWGRTPLHTAIWLRKQPAAEMLLSHGAQVNTATDSGQTPLHSAAANKNHVLVERLLAHGAKPNPKDDEGRTPASIAIGNGSEEIVKLLAAHLERTTLHSAASMGDIGAMAALIDSGVHIDRIDLEGRTALHAAVSAANLPAVQWLLDHGANATAASDHDVTPLSIAYRIAQDFSFSRDPNEVARFNALKEKQKQIVALLISHGALPYFALGISEEAARSHPQKVMDLLIEAGVNFEPHRDSRATLLHRAAWWGREQVVADLLQLAADVHATDEMGATPLHAATQSGSTRYWDVVQGPDVEVLELLIQHGADVNATNNASQTALHGAASYGDPNAVALLAKHGANINATDNANRTALHHAAEHAHIRAMDAMDILIANGADPNIVDNEGNTPLLLLLAGRITRDKDKAPMAQLAIDLIKRGVRVDAQNKQGITPLHYAAAQGHADILIELLRRGAPVNAPSTGGWTPLHGAVDNAHTQCVKTLIEHGAHVNTLGHESDASSPPEYRGPARTPLLLAISQGDNEIVQLLIAAGADIDLAGSDGQSPLYMAYYRNRRAAFARLLDAGANPDVCLANGVPLVYGAAANQRRETVDALLQHGARADADLIQTLLETGTTPLHTAAQKGDLNQVSQLLATGADPNIPDKRGYWPIHHAHAEGHIDIVKRLLPGTPASIVTDLFVKAVETRDRDRDMIALLIAHGADVNASNPRRMGSPLRWLAYDLETMELLLTHGADANATGGSNDTPLTMATRVKAKDAVALLLAHGADPNIPTADRHQHLRLTPLNIALANGSFDIARILVEAGADVSARRQWDDLPPLHRALPDRALFELILDHGAHINAPSRTDQTPLHIAADQGQTDNVQYLLDKGAAINAQDRDGNTPLHLAAGKGHSATCILLLDRQADITIRSKRGRLPLDYARAAELDNLIPRLTPNTP